MTVSNKQGGRSIELYLPFKFGSKRIAVITLHPIRWGQVTRWNDGGYSNALALLYDAVDQPEEVMREIRYPDVERVISAFIDLVPEAIREEVVMGMTPEKYKLTPEQIDNLVPQMHSERFQADATEPTDEGRLGEWPEPASAPEPEQEPAPEPTEPPPDHDEVVKEALKKGEKPWPEWPFAPGTPPGPEFKLPEDKKPEKPLPEGAEFGFDLSDAKR